MKSLNKVQLIGYLGKDPQVKELPNGNMLAIIRMATDQWLHQKEGGSKKHADWHTVKVWGTERVQKLRNYLIKGSHILVDGRIIYRTYSDRYGHTRYVTEIRANYLVDLDR